jgi:error-prone DNA polymerase
MALLRDAVAALGCLPAAALTTARPGARVKLAGLVLVRQRPGSAKGVVFVTLEDEGGVANLVVLPPVLRRCRAAVIGARLMLVEGRVERQDFGAAPIIHVLADRISDRSDLLARLSDRTTDPWADPWADPWEAAMARADEVKSPSLHDARVYSVVRRRAAYVPGSRDFR